MTFKDKAWVEISEAQLGLISDYREGVSRHLTTLACAVDLIGALDSQCSPSRIGQLFGELYEQMCDSEQLQVEELCKEVLAHALAELEVLELPKVTYKVANEEAK